MTNIMAIAYNGEPAEQTALFDNGLAPPYAVCMCDGLSSYGRGEVCGGVQKLVPIGRNYIQATGSGLHAEFIAERVAGMEHATPLELSKSIIEIARRDIVLYKDDHTNFIVAGPDEQGKIRMYHVLLNSINEPLPMYNLALDGSGSEFTHKALEREQNLGLNGNPSHPTIADLVGKLYDLGYEARKSAGVNDEFQYGFITPTGNATLAHPNINLKVRLKEYTDADGKYDEGKANANRGVFKVLNNRLYDLCCAQYKYNHLTSTTRNERRRLDAGTIQRMDELLCQIQELKDDVNSVIFDYVRRHNPPREEKAAQTSNVFIEGL